MTQKTDRTGPRAVDMVMALSLLTRLPLPHVHWPENRPAAAAAWAYPLVGLVVACIAGGLGVALTWAGMPAALVAGLILTVAVLLTGAMHEDGLADCADGFWGGWTPERRLEIMKDSQHGSYGALALTLNLGLRWIALSLLIEQSAVLPVYLSAAVFSRAAMVLVMTNLPPVRPGGLSAKTGQVPGWSTALGCMLAVVMCFVFLGLGGFLPIALGMLAAVGLLILARRKIEGQTGDVLGGTQQISETVFLITCASVVA